MGLVNQFAFEDFCVGAYGPVSLSDFFQDVDCCRRKETYVLSLDGDDLVFLRLLWRLELLDQFALVACYQVCHEKPDRKFVHPVLCPGSVLSRVPTGCLRAEPTESVREAVITNEVTDDRFHCVCWNLFRYLDPLERLFAEWPRLLPHFVSQVP